jgi:hypothetical protein
MRHRVWIMCLEMVASFTATGYPIKADPDRSSTTTAPASSGIEWVLEFKELLASKFGERTKAVGFDDPFDHRCPTGTILVSSVDTRLGFIIPQFNLTDAEDAKLFLQTGPMNSPDFQFSNRKCRYLIKMKKFMLNADGEKEIGPEPVDHAQINEQIAKDLKAAKASNPINPVQSPLEPDKRNAADELARRPLQGGTGRVGMRFIPNPAKLEFSGILFFSPWSASVYLHSGRYRRGGAEKSWRQNI